MTIQRYFEDLNIGEVRVSSTRCIERDELINFARIYDPQYFHADPSTAGESFFGDIIASGIHVMAIWRQLDHEIAQDIAWICGLAWRNVIFKTAVRGGDIVHARSECLAKRVSTSDPRRGVVEYRYQLIKSDGTLAWECESVNLVERSPTP